MDRIREQIQPTLSEFYHFFDYMVYLYSLSTYDGSHIGAPYGASTQANAKIAFFCLLNDGVYHAKGIEKTNKLRLILNEMAADNVKILKILRPKTNYSIIHTWEPSRLLLKEMVSDGKFKI